MVMFLHPCLTGQKLLQLINFTEEKKKGKNSMSLVGIIYNKGVQNKY